MHIMIDLETMGTSHDAPIFAIGAVAFNRKRGIVGAHYTAHNAVDDAEYQARRLLKIWEKIGDPDGAV